MPLSNGAKTEKWMFPLRYSLRYELEHLIEQSMFQEYKILCDYEGNELSEKSKEFIAICEKT